MNFSSYFRSGRRRLTANALRFPQLIHDYSRGAEWGGRYGVFTAINQAAEWSQV